MIVLVIILFHTQKSYWARPESIEIEHLTSVNMPKNISIDTNLIVF